MKEPEEMPDKKHRLIGSSIQMILLHGYASTTIDMICGQAEVSKGTFFHYFSSKDAIVESAMEAWSDAWKQILEAAHFNEIYDPVDRVFHLLDVMSATYMDPRGEVGCVVGMIAQELSHANENLRGACNRHFDMWLAPTTKLLADAKELIGADFDPDSVALFMISMVQGSMLVAKTRADRPMIADNVEHVRAYLTTLFLPVNNPKSEGNQ